MSYLVTFYVLFLSLFANAFTAPLEAVKRDEWSPIITYPHAGTIWYVGQRHNVTWDTWDAPVNITNSIGRIMFRFDQIETPLILASNFSVGDGRVEVTVPDVIKGDNYSLVLFGDSGHWSPMFSIYGGLGED